MFRRFETVQVAPNMIRIDGGFTQPVYPKVRPALDDHPIAPMHHSNNIELDGSAMQDNKSPEDVELLQLSSA